MTFRKCLTLSRLVFIDTKRAHNAEIIGIQSIRMIVPIKYMFTIFTVEVYCIDKFEDKQTTKCSTFFRMSKKIKPNFNGRLTNVHSLKQWSEIKQCEVGNPVWWDWKMIRQNLDKNCSMSSFFCCSRPYREKGRCRINPKRGRI